MSHIVFPNNSRTILAMLFFFVKRCEKSSSQNHDFLLNPFDLNPHEPYESLVITSYEKAMVRLAFLAKQIVCAL